MIYEQTEIYKTLLQRNVILPMYNDIIQQHLESNFEQIDDLRKIVHGLPNDSDIGNFWFAYEIIVHYNKVLLYYFKNLEELTETEFKLINDINKINRNNKMELDKHDKLQMVKYIINIFNYFYINKNKIIESVS